MECGQYIIEARKKREPGMETRTGSGEWRMENGMENGMETGSGEWKMEREMEAGRMALVGHRTYVYS